MKSLADVELPILDDRLVLNAHRVALKGAQAFNGGTGGESLHPSPGAAVRGQRIAVRHRPESCLRSAGITVALAGIRTLCVERAYSDACDAADLQCPAQAHAERFPAKQLIDVVKGSSANEDEGDEERGTDDSQSGGTPSSAR